MDVHGLIINKIIRSENMKEYKAKIKNDKEIVLINLDDLKDLYETIQQEENFIIKYYNISEVIISNNIVAKIMNGEIILKAEEK